MSLTERYVRADAAGGGDGTTDANSGAHGAFTLAEAFADLNTPREGYRYNVKKGNYSTAGVTLTGDGTPASPNVFEGFVNTPGDLRSQTRANGVSPWDTTNWPVITFDASTRLDSTGSNYLVWSCIKFVSGGTGYSGAFLYASDKTVFLRVVVTNPSTNVNAGCIYGGALAFDCDVFMTGASGGLFGIAACSRVIMCHVDIANSNTSIQGLRLGSNALVAFTRIVRCAGIGIDGLSATAAQQYTVLFCTIPQGVTGIRVGNVAYTGINIFIGNLIANMTGYAFDSQYVDTADLAAVFANNRVRDNSSGTQRGFTNWYQGTVLGEVSTDDSDANEFVNLAGQDVRLKSGSLAKGVGGAGSMDIGGVQRAEPTLPAAGDVQEGVTYGDGGTEIEGTFESPAEADVKKDVEYGNSAEFTGTYDPMSSAVFPPEADVLDSANAYGPTGEDYEGRYHAPDAAEVISTASYGVDSESNGTYVIVAAANVLDTVTFGPNSATQGAYHAPEASEVVDTAVFGPNSATQGTVALPAPSNVCLGVFYGAGGNEFEGEHECDLPVEEDVREGVQYDNGQAEGNLVLPAEEDVKASVQYGANGTELTGTLVAAMPWVGDRHGGLR